MGLGARE